MIAKPEFLEVSDPSHTLHRIDLNALDRNAMHTIARQSSRQDAYIVSGIICSLPSPLQSYVKPSPRLLRMRGSRNAYLLIPKPCIS